MGKQGLAGKKSEFKLFQIQSHKNVGTDVTKCRPASTSD